MAEILPVVGVKVSLSKFSRHVGQPVYRADDGRLYFGVWRRPSFAPSPSDRFHTVTDGDRPDLLAYAAYSTPELWWAIMAANGIVSPLDEVQVGDVLLVPAQSSVIGGGR